MVLIDVFCFRRGWYRQTFCTRIIPRWHVSLSPQLHVNKINPQRAKKSGQKCTVGTRDDVQLIQIVDMKLYMTASFEL